MLKPQTKGLLLDTTRCIGCGACALACKERNKLPKTSDDVLKDELSDKTYSVVKQVGPRYVRRMCMHCVTPSCASACPVAAFEKTAAGPVDLPRVEVHGLPLLHDRLPVRRSRSTSGRRRRRS